MENMGLGVEEFEGDEEVYKEDSHGVYSDKVSDSGVVMDSDDVDHTE